jgi:hypothetical protein
MPRHNKKPNGTADPHKGWGQFKTPQERSAEMRRRMGVTLAKQVEKTAKNFVGKARISVLEDSEQPSIDQRLTSLIRDLTKQIGVEQTEIKRLENELNVKRAYLTHLQDTHHALTGAVDLTKHGTPIDDIFKKFEETA